MLKDEHAQTMQAVEAERTEVKDEHARAMNKLEEYLRKEQDEHAQTMRALEAERMNVQKLMAKHAQRVQALEAERTEVKMLRDEHARTMQTWKAKQMDMQKLMAEHAQTVRAPEAERTEVEMLKDEHARTMQVLEAEQMKMQKPMAEQTEAKMLAEYLSKEQDEHAQTVHDLEAAHTRAVNSRTQLDDSSDLPQQNECELLDEDLGHLLDPASYFSSLDDLELKVAATFRFENYLSQQGVIDVDQTGKYEFGDCLFEIQRIQRAFQILEDEGFCKTQYTILVQDWKRLEDKKTLVARTISISRSFLSRVAEIENEVRKVYEIQDPTKRLPPTNAIAAIRNGIAALGFSIDYSKLLSYFMYTFASFPYKC